MYKYIHLLSFTENNMEINKHNLKNNINPSKYLPLFLLLLILFIFKVGIFANDKQEQKIYLVFRFDDYSARSNTELELRIIETFQKNNLAFTIGVIPFEGAGNLLDPTPQGNLPLGKEKGDILKYYNQLETIEIALHGYSHQSHSHDFIRSEFRGLNYESQKEKIIQGKAHLENISESNVVTFIPPWNQYDFNTLKILEELQFKNNSGDRIGKMNNITSIQSLPNSCGLTKVKDAVIAARESSDEELIIVALFHAYDFIEDSPESGILDFDYFSDLINWISEQNDVKVLTIDQMVSKLPGDYLKEKYQVNRKIFAYSIKIPPYIRGEAHPIYASISYLQLLRIKAITSYALLFAIISIFAYIILNSLKAFISNRYRIVAIANVLVLLIMIFYCFYNPQFGYNIGGVFTLISSLIFTSTIILMKSRRVLMHKK